MSKKRYLYAAVTILVMLLNTGKVFFASADSGNAAYDFYGYLHDDGIIDMNFVYPDSDRYADCKSITAFYDSSGAMTGMSCGDIAKRTSDYFSTYQLSIPADSSAVKTFVWNDMIPKTEPISMTSAEFSDRIYDAVPELPDTGNIIKRASFETDTLEMFRTNRMPYAAVDFVRTDEVKAHTGRYCLKVSGRNSYSASLQTVIKAGEFDADSKITVSYWARYPEGITDRFRIIATIKASDGTTKYSWIGKNIANVSTEWAYVSGTLDFANLHSGEMTGASYTGSTENDIYIEVTTGRESDDTQDYYVDDLMITIDKAGEIYDDMNYTPEPLPEGMSETAYTISSSDEYGVQQELGSLKDIYKDYFKIGAAMYESGSADNRYTELLKKHFGSVTPNGYMKMAQLVKSDRTTYNFTETDKFVDFCRKNGIDDIIGHVLIWDSSTYNSYFAGLDRDGLLAFMKEYITKVMAHYDGKGDASEYAEGIDYSDWRIDTWDVVNEASDGYNIYKKDGPMYAIAGSEYVDYAYKYAGEYEEASGRDIDLRYNDCGEWVNANGTAIQMVARNVMNNAPDTLDTVALQSHFRIDHSIEKIENTMNKVWSLGLKADVSELDISAYTDDQTKTDKVPLYENGLPSEVETAQVDMLKTLFDFYKENSDKINRVTFWTYTDRVSYRNTDEFFVKTDYAGIFDRNFRAKPQYYAISGLNWNFEDEADFLKDEWSFPYTNADGSSKGYNYYDMAAYGDNVVKEGEDDRFAVGKWTALCWTDFNRRIQPAYIPISDAIGYNQYYRYKYPDKGSASYPSVVKAPADGSTQCAVVRTDGLSKQAQRGQVMGMRVKLSKEQVQPGATYDLSFWHMNNSLSSGNLFAFFRRFNGNDDDLVYTELNDTTTDGLPWLDRSASNAVGVSQRYWQRYSTELTLTEDDFDEDGYTTLWILMSAGVNYSTPSFGRAIEGEYAYFDDISLIKK